MHSDKQLDDRLSALLDGELSSEEAAQLDRELARDPELRLLRDELLALRHDLQALPVQQPSAELTGRIMAAIAEKQRETAAPVTPVTVQKKSLPAWATFALGMVASAALMLLAFSLFNQTPKPNDVVTVPTTDPGKRPPKERGEGEWVDPSPESHAPSTEIANLALANDAAQIAEVLQSRADQAGVVHILRLQMPAGRLRGGALDQALISQKIVVSGVLDRKEVVPHVALAYRSLPQSRLIAGEATSQPRPLAEIVYLELPANRVTTTLASLATVPTGKFAPEVRLAQVPTLIEVASAPRRNPDRAEAESPDDGQTGPRKQIAPSPQPASNRPFAIRIGAKQLVSALGDSVQSGEFAGPQDDQVDVLFFVRVQPVTK